MQGYIQFYSISVLILFSFLGYSQTEKNHSTTDWIAYEMAMKNEDFVVAKTLLYQLIAKNPNNLHLQDSLATLYFRTKDYVQCVKIGKPALERDTNNVKLTSILAVSYQVLKQYKEALDLYFVLYEMTYEMEHLYQISALQYELKLTNDCLETCEKLIHNGRSPLTQLQLFFLDDNGTKSAQNVTLDAIAYNLKGVINKEQSNIEDAMRNFEKALELAPDFRLAKGNLASLTKEINGE